MARRDTPAAENASTRADARELEIWLRANRGFLEVSLGNYEAALAVLHPAIDGLFIDPDYTEIMVAAFVSDAVEAMGQSERFDDAQTGRSLRTERPEA